MHVYLGREIAPMKTTIVLIFTVNKFGKSSQRNVEICIQKFKILIDMKYSGKQNDWKNLLFEYVVLKVQEQEDFEAISFAGRF